MRRLERRIDSAESGSTVETILRRGLYLSGGAVRRAKVQPAGILLDGEAVFTNTVVEVGQILSVAVGDANRSPGVTGVPGPLCIRYEDEDLLVIDKPARVAVHPGPGHYDDTLANRLVAYYQNNGLVAGFHPVNRLDRGTSGLMVVAKHAHAHERLQDMLHTGAFVREYLAVCQGIPDPPQGVIDRPIGRVEGQVLRREVRMDGAPARTRYRTLRTGEGRALVALTLETGRTHQIRIHLAAMGCPLAGDFLYGNELQELPDRFALHSAHLHLCHPITGVEMDLQSPLPEELTTLFTGKEGAR